MQMGRAGPMEDPSRRESTREKLSWAGKRGRLPGKPGTMARAQGSKPPFGLCQGDGAEDQGMAGSGM